MFPIDADNALQYIVYELLAPEELWSTYVYWPERHAILTVMPVGLAAVEDPSIWDWPAGKRERLHGLATGALGVRFPRMGDEARIALASRFVESLPEDRRAEVAPAWQVRLAEDREPRGHKPLRSWRDGIQNFFVQHDRMEDWERFAFEALRDRAAAVVAEWGLERPGLSYLQMEEI